MTSAEFMQAYDSVKNKKAEAFNQTNPFANNKDNKIQSLIKKEEGGVNYQHLSNFLKEQIATQKKQNKSQVSQNKGAESTVNALS